MSLAKKLTDAGADTLGARFTNICLDVLREKPDNIQQAWINAGDRFGYEFIVALKRDMEWHEPPKTASEEPRAVKAAKK